MAFQKRNPKTKAYQLFRKDKETGRLRIVNVKEKEPTKPFKGVPIKRK